MVKRRQFLGGLTALAGSYLLSACGGGGEDGGARVPRALDVIQQRHGRTEVDRFRGGGRTGTALPAAGSRRRRRTTAR